MFIQYSALRREQSTYLLKKNTCWSQADLGWENHSLGLSFFTGKMKTIYSHHRHFIPWFNKYVVNETLHLVPQILKTRPPLKMLTVVWQYHNGCQEGTCTTKVLISTQVHHIFFPLGALLTRRGKQSLRMHFGNSPWAILIGSFFHYTGVRVIQHACDQPSSNWEEGIPSTAVTQAAEPLKPTYTLCLLIPHQGKGPHCLLLHILLLHTHRCALQPGSTHSEWIWKPKLKAKERADILVHSYHLSEPLSHL